MVQRTPLDIVVSHSRQTMLWLNAMVGGSEEEDERRKVCHAIIAIWHGLLFWRIPVLELSMSTYSILFFASFIGYRMPCPRTFPPFAPLLQLRAMRI